MSPSVEYDHGDESPAVRPVLDRPRLFALLDDGVRGPLSVVSGPAGTGKTTLIHSWLAARERTDAVYVALSTELNQPARFWAEVRDALLAGARVLARPLVSGRVSQSADDIRREAFGLIAASGGSLVLVLDDLHLITDEGIVADLDALRRMPAVHLVVSARGRVPIASRRGLILGELVELDADELAFTEGEVAQLCQSQSQSQSQSKSRADDGTGPSEVVAGWATTVLAHTDGWAAAVRLAAESLVRSAPAPGDASRVVSRALRTFTEFVMDEIVGGLSVADRELTLRTCISDDLTDQLASELSGRPAGSHGVRALMAAGLLTETEFGGGRFRYRRPVLDALRTQQSLDLPHETLALHRVAARWYARSGRSMEAVQHARQAGDVALLAELLGACWPALVFGAGRDLTSALAALPGSIWRRDPSLVALRIISAGPRGELHSPAFDLDAVLGQHPAAHEPNGRDVDGQLLLMAARIEFARARGRPDEERALAELAAHRLHARTSSTEPTASDGQLLLQVELGVSRLLAGELGMAIELLAQASEAAVLAGRPYLAVMATSHWALAEALLGRVEAADRHIAMIEALDGSSVLLSTEFAVPLHIAAALTATERGDQAAAHSRLGRARQCGPRREHLLLIAYVGGMLRLQTGDVAVGLVGVEAALAEAGNWAAPSLPHAAIVSARAALLAISGRADEAVAAAGTIHADDLHALCPNGVIAFAELNAGQFDNARRTVTPCLAAGPRHAPRTLVLALVVATLAAEGAGDVVGAEQFFRQALATAAVTGVRQAFALISADQLVALVERVRPGAEPTIAKLCAVLAEGRAQRRRGILSERERYVLGQLAGDATVAGIAVALFVSPNTVKTQIRMIYRKLGVASRAAAVAEGHRLSLV